MSGPHFVGRQRSVMIGISLVEMRQRRVIVMNGDAKDMGPGRAGMRMHRLGMGMRGHMFEMA
ncbi:MAG TPA: hypothetical protein VM468_08860, partial [Mycoplana sp.]|nr:hypothetical protein [Mycoplana sp.]